MIILLLVTIFHSYRIFDIFISGSFKVVFGVILGFVYAPLVITGLHHMADRYAGGRRLECGILVKPRSAKSLNYYNIMIENGKTREEALKILRRRSRDNGRTPMQWNNGSNAGFTNGAPWIMPPDNYKTINARAEEQDEDSVLNYYKSLIRLRKENPVISDGQIEFFDTKCNDVFAYRRFLDNDEIYVINNLTEKEIELDDIHWTDECEKIIENYDGTLAIGSAVILRPYETIVYKNWRRLQNEQGQA